MKKSRYLLKRTKFALSTAVLPTFLGILLIASAILLLSFNVWANTLAIDSSLLPMANNVPTFYDINGNELPYQSDNYISADEIPQDLKNAFVALEDKRFYEHDGFDTYRIASALIKNITNGGIVEGASTITQQLIKNTHLTFEKTASRKLKELALATKLEQIYSKDEILSMYLSVIYFGNGAYGVKSASKQYFGKELNKLTLAECATLAGIVKNPSKYSPKNNLGSSMSRRNIVLETMFSQGYITYSQMVDATNENMTILPNENKNLHKFFVAKAIEEACQKLNITKYQLDNSGLKIYTTFNPEIQSLLEENGNLNSNFSNKNIPNSSIVIDNTTGFVLAYNSSLGYEISRQGGSTLKPLIVYAPALEKDIVTLATPIDDGRIKIGNWTPKNYGDKYVGISNVRDAIKHSSNTVAVKVATYIGETTMYEYGTKFGMSLCENDKNLTLALGATTKGQNPLQIAKAYTIFSNGGKMKNTTFLRYIVDNGKKIYTHKALENQVVTKETAFLIRDCLIDTAQDGTAKTLSALPFSVASKTGTVSSNNTNTDGWNVSFNDKFTIVVWHGDAVNETGGGHPTKHAYNIWSDLSKNLPKELFISSTNTPNTIIKMAVDVYSTNKLMQVAMATNHTPKKYIKYEYFKQSKQPNYAISLFEKCPIKFAVSAKNDKKMVEINFVADEIYTYKLIRKDVLGEHIIGDFNGKNTVTIYDKPLFFGFPIEYTLIAYPKGQSNVVGVCTKTILI